MHFNSFLHNRVNETYIHIFVRNRENYKNIVKGSLIVIKKKKKLKESIRYIIADPRTYHSREMFNDKNHRSVYTFSYEAEYRTPQHLAQCDFESVATTYGSFEFLYYDCVLGHIQTHS